MQTAKADIDVVIPVYNGESYIEATINSVFTQTLLPANLFVINDGSTDGTQQILENIKSKNSSGINIHIIFQSNKGLSAARNAGIAASQSAYLAFLDADDIWLPEKLKVQLDVFQRTELKNAGLVFCNYNVIDENGNKNPEGEIIKVRRGLRGNVFTEIQRGNLISGSGSGVLIKRECFEKAGTFDEQLKAFEDWDMWLRIAILFEFDYTEEILLSIRMHSKSMQKDVTHMNKNALLFYKKWLPRISDKETLRQWAFRIAKPAYKNGYNNGYLSEVKQVFTREELKKLFSKTFGSIGFYVFLKRIKPN